MIATGTLGALFVLGALVFASFGALGAFALARRGDPRALRFGTTGALGFFACMLAANATMVAALVGHDFSVQYVAPVGSRATPLLFRIVSLWSALEGSILFWGLILGGYVAAYAWVHRREEARFVPYALGTLLAVAVFFAFLIAGPANPFSLVDPAPADGPGPNPLLQNHLLMVVHPPILYMGYVGMTVPFGVAIGALLAGEFGERWMGPLRRWTMVGWAFLTCGIIIGAWWAYAVLGWGGYWAWDPVENASFLPWLTATAFIHATIVQERRHLLKAWTLALALATFILTILGTFMTRSGVFNSVHSFTQSDIGPTFLVFIGVILLVSIVLLSARSHLLVSTGRLQSFASRDAAFLMNNLLFVALTFTVLLGTLYPLVAEAVRGVKVSVGEPYFNKMSLPIGVAILFLMGMGPALPWGQPSAKTWRQLLLPLAAAGVVVIACLALGLSHGWATLTFALAAFATVVTLREMSLPVRARMRDKGEGFAAATRETVRRAQRRMGGYVVHLAVVLVFVAIAASRAYVTRAQATLAAGAGLEISGYTLSFKQLRSGDEGHRRYVDAELDVAPAHGAAFKLFPRVNYYPRSTDPIGTPAVRDTLTGDLYVSLQAYEPTAKTATLNVWFFPLVSWIWWSIPLFVLGSAIALWPMRVQMPKKRAEEHAAAVRSEA